MKIYQPYSKFKWLSNTSVSDLQGLSQLPKSGDTLVITKSLKDVMCLDIWGIPAVAPSSESCVIPSDIVKQLYSHNLIKNQWSDNTDGLEAMIQIMKTSEKAEKQNIPLKRFTEIKKIIYYNYMDCKVISDILTMLEQMI